MVVSRLQLRRENLVVADMCDNYIYVFKTETSYIVQQTKVSVSNTIFCPRVAGGHYARHTVTLKWVFRARDQVLGMRKFL